MQTPTKEQLADPKWWDENAPYGTTHYGTSNDIWAEAWYKREGDEDMVFLPEILTWMETGSGRTDLIPRPTYSQWRGPEDGLPPVGMEVDFKYKNVKFRQNWVRVSPMFYGSNLAVLKHSASGNEFSQEIENCEFRPIRTPEQIAAEEERGSFISEICSLLAWDAEYDGPKVAAGKLYDAGYRKQEKQQ